VFGSGQIAVDGGGNVLAAAAFLYGLSAGELTPAELDYADSAFDVTITARALKRCHE
jgi:hypothetical protein